MKSLRYIFLLAWVGMFAGCDEDGGVTTAPDVPLAFTRFVNVVPDTLATDWRFIDQLEYSPIGIQVAFRGFTPYQGTRPGGRPLRVFPSTGDLSTQNFLTDQSVALSADKYYSLIQLGYSRPGQAPADELWALEDVHPTVPAGKIAVRVVHAGAALGPVDVFASPAGGNTPLPATPLFANVAYKTATAYAILDTLPNTRLASLSATTTGYARTTGSFLTDGFRVGMQISASGFNGTNNGRSFISAVTATTITINGPTTGAISVSAVPADSSYKRTTGSFFFDGFEPGMGLVVTGFGTAGNNGTTTVTRVTDSTLHVAKALVAEAEAPGRTITRATVVQAEAANRRIVGELVLRATAAGTRTPIVAQTAGPPGEEGNAQANLTWIGGATSPLSVISAMLMPRSVSPSRAAAFDWPAFVYMIDKHPR